MVDLHLCQCLLYLYIEATPVITVVILVGLFMVLLAQLDIWLSVKQEDVVCVVQEARASLVDVYNLTIRLKRRTLVRLFLWIVTMYD